MLGRHAGAPDRGRGQRDRADQVRVRRDRPVRGHLDVPRRHGPARRGRRHRGHDLARTTCSAPASRCSPRAAAAATSPRRPRPRPAGCSRSATSSSELGYVDMFTDMLNAIDAGREPVRDVLRRLRRQRGHGRLLPRRRASGSGSRCELDDWRGGAAARIAPRAPRVRRQDGDQGGEDARRPLKLILKDEETGEISDAVVDADADAVLSRSEAPAMDELNRSTTRSSHVRRGRARVAAGRHRRRRRRGQGHARPEGPQRHARPRRPATSLVTNDGVTIAGEIELEPTVRAPGRAARQGGRASRRTTIAGDGTTTATAARAGDRPPRAAQRRRRRRPDRAAARDRAGGRAGRRAPARRAGRAGRRAASRSPAWRRSPPATPRSATLIGEAFAERRQRRASSRVEASDRAGVELELIEGMSSPAATSSPHMVTDPERMEAVLEDAVHPDLGRAA